MADSVLPQARGVYASPYAGQRARLQEQLDALTNAPGMYTPEEQQQRRGQNDMEYQLGLLGMLSGDQQLGGVGGHVFKQALANRQPKTTERGSMDPLTGTFKHDPEFLRREKQAQIDALDVRDATSEQAWNLARENAAERAEQRRQHDEAMRQMRAAGGGKDFERGTKLRNELNTRLQKVAGGTAFAQQVMQLVSDPSIARDPTKQVALVTTFGKMLDPESVVREAEYAMIANARGAFESLIQYPQQLMTGARLTHQQLTSMQQVAASLMAGAQGREDIVRQQYGDIADRYGIPREDVLPYRPGRTPAAGGGGVVDVGAALGRPAAGGGKPQALPKSNPKAATPNPMVKEPPETRGATGAF